MLLSDPFDLLLISFFLVVFWQETIQQNSQEQIKQDKVSNEDPRYIVQNWWERPQGFLPHRVIQDRVPILCRQHLKHRQEPYDECIVVTSGFTIFKVKLAAE